MYSKAPQFMPVNTSRATTSNIFIALRVRGLLYEEYERCGVSTISVKNSQSVSIEYPHDLVDSFESSRRSSSNKGKRAFVYDRVFDESTSQQAVFESTALPLIDSVLGGINATVFAYGATGAGKTYTMIGSSSHPGIMVLTLYELFGRISDFSNINVKCSFIEIYNEIVYDLLSQNDKSAVGITEIVGISGIEQMMQLLMLGNERRSTEPTAANETSSRSHAILQVTIEQNGADGETVYSKLSLIDLAGSERARDTLNNGLRFVEGGNINKSLLALGNCIQALASGANFVPYRDSKLTRLLQDSLGGNCKTVMIANVSPFVGHFNDSLNTLKFAIRARNMKMKLTPNSRFDSPKDEIRKYKRIIAQLESQVCELTERLNRANVCESPDSSGLSTDMSTEYVIKNSLMQTITEQLRVRSELSQIEQQIACASPKSALSLTTAKEELVKVLRDNNERTNWLHQSVSNLAQVRTTTHATPSPMGFDHLPPRTTPSPIVMDRTVIPTRTTPNLLRNKSTLNLPTAKILTGTIQFN